MTRSDTNALEVSVSELSGKLKRTVEDTFGHVRVRGEISGYRGPHSSGHSYFSLKDEKARLEAVIWRGQAAKLKHLPEEGLEVIASGKLTTYPGSSKYQIVIDALEPAGAGALMALLEERKRKLGAEGLFAEERKQLIPYMPKVIGVVTSPTGAVIRDILHRISERFPVHVIVWPVRVQGDTCGAEVANGVYQLNQFDGSNGLARPDVIIVARGGGSLEDLWGFNDEAAVRSVAQSMIPVISAVGHETDWTLLDLVADLRAPTPTAAAEQAVPVRADLQAFVADLGARLRGAMSRNLERQSAALRSAARALPSHDMLLALPRRRFDEASSRLERSLVQRVERAQGSYRGVETRLRPLLLDRRLDRSRERLLQTDMRHKRAFSRLVERSASRLAQAQAKVSPFALQTRVGAHRLKLDQLSGALPRLAVGILTDKRSSLNEADRLLKTLSYKSIVARGYAVVKTEEGRALMSAQDVTPGMSLAIEMADGSVKARAEGPAEAPKKAPHLAKKKPKAETRQGDLF